ncbi:uncharacterized protein LOC141600306 isoform X2 [Silene latifolia]|uniref:uncharacterized protein LOC141600306 isoform X2 n=1 Tax=Silene latifolia TaxID=37657 RepID=UPI003D786330
MAGSKSEQQTAKKSKRKSIEGDKDSPFLELREITNTHGRRETTTQQRKSKAPLYAHTLADLENIRPTQKTTSYINSQLSSHISIDQFNINMFSTPIYQGQSQASIQPNPGKAPMVQPHNGTSLLPLRDITNKQGQMQSSIQLNHGKAPMFQFQNVFDFTQVFQTPPHIQRQTSIQQSKGKAPLYNTENAHQLHPNIQSQLSIQPHKGKSPLYQSQTGTR